MNVEAKKQILVVEDEGLIADDIRRQLQRLGYAVPAIASTGEDALRIARSMPVDLALMDIRLRGELDGIATARALKEELQVPAVYITAHADQETIDRATLTEPFGYILKPVTDGDLRSAVQIALYKDEMQRRLRASEAWLATTLRSVGEGILATDTTGEIVFMNPVAEQLTGWTAAEAHGRLLMDVLGLHDPGDSGPANNPIFDLPEGARREYTLFSIAGTSTHVEVECFENRSADYLLGSIVAVRDIGPRKEIEARLLQSQRMEAIAGMAGGIAHDFNNQLTVILGHAAELAVRLSGEQRQEAQAIHDAASQAATLTTQLLTLARRDVARPEMLNLNEVLREILPSIEHLLQPSATLLTRFPGPVAFIRADRAEIKQVFLNLALHAQERMPAGGELLIECGAVEVVADEAAHHQVPPGDYARIFVSAGDALDAATLDRVFEPLSLAKPDGLGRALALGIVHSIVKRSGGVISADCPSSRPAGFTILFPCAGTFVESEDPAAPTIMLVEDEDSVRHLMHKFLERDGYQFLEAASAEAAEALAAAYSEPIDLLITDVVMPGLSGPELADRLASLRPQMKLLYVSGYRHDTLDHQGLLHRRLNLLSKPFPVSEFLKRVRTALEEEAAPTR